MSISAARTSDIELAAIKRLLLKEWDPIGIAEEPKAADEYDSYALRVVTMLRNGATIAEYLEQVVTEAMKLSADAARDQRIAKKIVALHARYTGNVQD